MRLPSDFETAEEVLSVCLCDPDSLVIILVSAYGSGGASNALLLHDLAGGQLFTPAELARHVNRLIVSGLMRSTSKHNAMLTALGRVILHATIHTQ